MKVLITGADGQLGTDLCRALNSHQLVPLTIATTQSKLLEQKELLRRAPSPADARVVRLSLTDKTRKHLAGLADQHKAFKKTVFEVFNEAELAEFTAKLAMLNNRLEKTCLIAAMDFES